MIFKPILLSDEAKISLYLSQSPSGQLIDCFEAFYLWRDALGVQWAEVEGFALFRVHYRAGEPQYLFPFGAGDPAPVIERLRRDCARQGIPLRLAKVRQEQLLYLQERFPGAFTATGHRDHAEYLFETARFHTYSGKALQPKRNLVNYARKAFDWHYEPVAPANLAECCAFANRFSGDESFAADSEALSEALTHFEALPAMSGGVIRIAGAIAALFICTGLGDGQTAAGLFLRGDHDKRGVIPLLYQLYFIDHPEFRYFNFGEDLGLDGLRQNKLSFQPSELLELYEVEEIQ
ncbi:MAG: phosphatidylglycerol lysyltransferase domain-containing protein [Rikenellaceae bacterium]|nr:phosphatidylglycerol lysyltransferase domain-containing protein [Rikenellaceae bacterium]